MNALVKLDIPSLTMSEPELIKVLEASIYPGAAVESIKLVIGYCRAQHLDPILKPVHIVPMDVKVKKQGGGTEYVKRDVVMPGIGLYRIQAARTSEYAGISEPEFGPTQKMEWKVKYRETEEGPELERTVEFEYPEWCRMTVRRIVGSHIAEFTATEFWLENFATKGRDSKQPNAMWTKRARGQIAKCTEAQALRKAFPEIGAQPTADEMEGKTLDTDSEGNIIDGKTGEIIQPKIQRALSKSEAVVGASSTAGAASADPAAGQSASSSETSATASSTATVASPGLIKNIQNKLDGCAKALGVNAVDLMAECLKTHGLTTLENMNTEQGKAIQTWIRQKQST